MRHGIVILPQTDWPEAARRWRQAEEYGFDHAGRRFEDEYAATGRQGEFARILSLDNDFASSLTSAPGRAVAGSESVLDEIAGMLA